MRLPTVRLMVSRGFTKEQATQIREAMEGYERKHPFGDRRPTLTMEKIDRIIDGNGIEEIPEGNNKKSPAIMYVNMGDSYDITVMFVKGQFVIGAWADIVERGNYP